MNGLHAAISERNPGRAIFVHGEECCFSHGAVYRAHGFRCAGAEAVLCVEGPGSGASHGAVYRAVSHGGAGHAAPVCSERPVHAAHTGAARTPGSFAGGWRWRPDLVPGGQDCPSQGEERPMGAGTGGRRRVVKNSDGNGAFTELN